MQLVKRATNRLEVCVEAVIKLAKDVAKLEEKMKDAMSKGGGASEYNRLVRYATRLEELKLAAETTSDELTVDLLDRDTEQEAFKSAKDAKTKVETTASSTFDQIHEATMVWLNEVQRREQAATLAAERAATDATAAAAAAAESPPTPVEEFKGFKEYNAFRPEILHKKDSLGMMRLWLRAMSSWFGMSRVDKAKPEQRMQAFMTRMEPELVMMWEAWFKDNGVDVETEASFETMKKGMSGVFERMYPVATRRWNMSNTTQKHGEKASEFVARLEQEMMAADYEEMSKEELLCTAVLLQRLLDSQVELKKKIFELPKLTLIEIKKVIWAHEKTVMDCNRYSASQGDQIRGTGPGRDQGGKRQLEGECFKCNLKGHRRRDCKVKNLKCKECDSVGMHNSRAAECPKSEKGKLWAANKSKFQRNRRDGRGRGRDNARGTRADDSHDDDDNDYSEDEPSDMAGRARVTRERTRATKSSPEIACDIGTHCLGEDQFKVTFTNPCLADTGSTRGLISKFIADKHGIEILGRGKEYDLTNANGGKMEVTGSAVIWVKPSARQGDKWTRVSALVTPDLADNEIYLSETDLKNMGIIPSSFPHCEAGDFTPGDKVRATSAQQLDPEIEEACEEFADIFAENLTGRRPISSGGLARIILKDGAVPVCASVARRPPRALAQQAEALLQELLQGGIIEEVVHATDWCAHAVFVQKPDGRARLVADYSPINKWVVRPHHGFKSSEQLRNEVEYDTRYMIVGDLCHGYLQVEIEPEDRDYTCFLVATTQGTRRYRYTRSPMGLNCSSDHFCRKSDTALEGIKVAKLVDDVLVEGPSKDAALVTWRQVMERAREHGLTFSKSKLRYGERVKFGGFILDASKGTMEVKPDPGLLEAIKDFPLPKNITELRSFLGLSQQISAWCPDLKQSTTKCRKLLCAGINFYFTPEMIEEFENCKQKMTTPPNLSPFDPTLPCILLTDASKIYGLGYLLLQKKKEGEGHQIVQAGSLSITPTQARYAVVELEALGIVCAVKKCHYWLSGLDYFRVLSDHKPLVGLWTKPLAEISNMRLLSFVEKMMPYSFTVEYFPGKMNMAADCLSRTPVGWAQSAADEDPAELSGGPNRTRKVFCKYSNRHARSDPALKQLFKDAELDDNYQKVVEAVRKGAKLKELESYHPARRYAKWYEDLSAIDDAKGTLLVYDDTRLVIPDLSRQRIKEALHLGHAGVVKTLAAASRYYLWPNMTNEITEKIKDCVVCIERLARQPNEPMMKDRDQAREPMFAVGMDHCVYEKQNYLVMVDEFSSFPLVTKVRSTDADDLILHAEAWFLDLGFPRIIKSDGGPAFTSRKWDLYCEERFIDNVISSAANPESNGGAESGVSRTKGTIKKACAAREDPGTAVAEFRNLPLAAGGVSPHELFYKRTPRGRLPHLDIPYDDDKATKMRQAHREKFLQRDTSRKPSRKFEVGEKVWLYNRDSHMWNLPSVILERRGNDRSYHVRVVTTGGEYLRNRKFLKPRTQLVAAERSHDPGLAPADAETGQAGRDRGDQPQRERNPTEGQQTAAEPRRSKRLEERARKDVDTHDDTSDPVGPVRG